MAWEAACSMEPALTCGLLEPPSLVLVQIPQQAVDQARLTCPRPKPAATSKHFSFASHSKQRLDLQQCPHAHTQFVTAGPAPP